MTSADVQDLLAKGIRAARQNQEAAAERILQQVVAVDTENELAWLWLARVSQSGDNQAACLERVLALNPNNRWAAHYLAVLKGEADENEDPFAPPTEAKRQVEVLKCPNCGGATKLNTENAKTVVCRYCDSVVDLTPEQAAVVGRKNNINPSQPIEPGMEGTFNGRKYLVVGWLRFKGFDDEEVWFWDEWLMVGEDGSVLWISYDSEEGFLLNEKIPLDEAFDPRTARKIPVPDGNATIRERGEARIRGINGELTWKAKIGETVHYIEASQGRQPYSIEYTREEIELYRGTQISEEDVWTAFGKTELVEAMRAAQAKGLVTKDGKPRRPKAQILLLGILWLTLIASLVGIIFSFFSGDRILNQSVNLNKGQEQQVGPIMIKQINRPHKLKLRSGSLSTDTWATVTADIITPNGDTFPLLSGQFWRETGYDSEGRWDESDLTAAMVFRPTQTGEHHLKLRFTESKSVNSANVTASIWAGVVLKRYFVITAILSVIFMIIFGKRQEN